MTQEEINKARIEMQAARIAELEKENAHYIELLFKCGNRQIANNAEAMEKIYISGKITDNANYKAQFSSVEKHLQDLGYSVINPARLELPDGATWADYMRHDIKLLCDCDAIYMLHGWRESAGAKIEHKLARDLGMKIIYERKKPVYNAEYRREQYIKNREEKLKKRKEYYDQHREKINRKARARYRAKCGLKAIKEA